ncbi:hypothetical protein AAG906_028128 [Vitis piasezkii]
MIVTVIVTITVTMTVTIMMRLMDSYALALMQIGNLRIGSSRWGCNYGDACFPNRYGFSKSSFNPLKWQNRW